VGIGLIDINKFNLYVIPQKYKQPTKLESVIFFLKWMDDDDIWPI